MPSSRESAFSLFRAIESNSYRLQGTFLFFRIKLDLFRSNNVVDLIEPTRMNYTLFSFCLPFEKLLDETIKRYDVISY